MRVSVRMFTTLRELAGKGEETLEFGVGVVTVKDVLGELVRRHGKAFKDYLYDEEERVEEHLQLLVNGKRVGLLEELETRLKEGDQVAIVPPIGGG
ncbi:MAG: MoaD family protein [Candidatus Bathyarchaeota archaeon]|nr:MoaD family protein [Candidatus Bathyarchaeota archaeon]MDH5494306.1 MoaD family protein [Candidatus Bathyarchaeota archaeon]